MTTPIEPYQALLELHLIPEINEQARPFGEMAGFICAISASPETLDLADWFPLSLMQKISMQQAPSFSSEKIASDFAAAVLQFYDHCSVNYQQSAPLSLPLELWLTAENEITAQGMAFASGYLSGFDRIESAWQGLNLSPESESGQLLQTTVLLLSKMAAGKNQDPQMRELFMQLPAMAEIVSALPALLSALGHCAVAVSNNG